MVKVKKIKKRYIFDGKVYLGQYFDKRLILDVIANYYSKEIDVEQLYSLLTRNIGKEKFFLGIDQRKIKSLNKKDLLGLNNFSDELTIKEEDNFTLIRDYDGVLFVRAKGSNEDEQITKGLKEAEVKERLSLIIRSINNEPHQCGAPCRSKDKEGKPCEKLTFRNHCHFHRD